MKDQLIYHGKVNVKILNTDRVSVKTNNGTDLLFNFFARALCNADTIADEEYPTSIDLVYETKDTNNNTITVSYLFAPRPITRALIQDDDKLAVRFTGKISKSNMKSDPPANDISTFKLKLKDGHGYDLASVPVEADAIAAVDIGRQALIQWDLSVGNPSDTDTTSSNSK